MDQEQLRELQQAALYRTMRKVLRACGIGALVFGALLLVLGAALLQLGDASALLILPGLLLAGQAILMIAAPRPLWLASNGALFILTGLLGALALALAPTAVLILSLGLYGPVWLIFLVFWGVYNLYRYREFARLPATRPAERALATLDRVADQIRLAPLIHAPNVIQISLNSMISQESWRVRLDGDVLTFLALRTHEMLLARLAEVQIQQHGKAYNPAFPRVQVRIGARALKGMMPIDSFNRFQHWQNPNPDQPGGLWVPHI